MRIVETDNFGGDYPNEEFIAINIPTIEMANVMAAALNTKYSGDDAREYYKVVEADYELQPGFEP